MASLSCFGFTVLRFKGQKSRKFLGLVRIGNLTTQLKRLLRAQRRELESETKLRPGHVMTSLAVEVRGLRV